MGLFKRKARDKPAVENRTMGEYFNYINSQILSNLLKYSIIPDFGKHV